MNLLEWTVLAILAVQEDPSSRLRRELDVDEVESREAAAARLVAAGEAIRPVVLKALRETDNVEVRKRLEGVLGLLDAKKRLESFQGGKVVGGLGAKLSITHVKEEHLLELTLEISNLGLAEREIFPLLRWDTKLPNRWHTSSSAEGEVEVKQLTGTPKGGLSGSLG